MPHSELPTQTKPICERCGYWPGVRDDCPACAVATIDGIPIERRVERGFAFEDRAAHAPWRLVVVFTHQSAVGYGFNDEVSARAGMESYARSPQTRGVWVEEVA